MFAVVESVGAIRWSDPGSNGAVAGVPLKAGKPHVRGAVVVAAPGEVAPVPQLDTEVTVGTRASHKTPVSGPDLQEQHESNKQRGRREVTKRDPDRVALRRLHQKKTDLV